MNRSTSATSRIVVVGAGAFGAWTALHLQQRGVQTVLVDGLGPGNSRASSGGDTRVIRGAYGGHSLHTSLAVRSLKMWHRYQETLREPLFFESGVLWLLQQDDSFVADSLAQLESLGHPVEHLSLSQARSRFDKICLDGIDSVYYEPTGGYLAARKACRQVTESFLDSGGTLIQDFVLPPATSQTRLQSVSLSDGSRLEADSFLFACGPWLPKLFPDLSPHLTVTRQEVFFFGSPPDLPLAPTRYPVVLSLPTNRFYSLPAGPLHDFKVGDDMRGRPFDPTHSDRTPDLDILERCRDWMESRFPCMRGAPVTASRVCQYSRTTDGGFIVGVHPRLDNLWLLGGGNGHAFKMGPALGELVGRAILEEVSPPPEMAPARFL